ncbi:hypothetical protein ACFL6Y_08660 [Elusimicrobiota bacterium]
MRHGKVSRVLIFTLMAISLIAGKLASAERHITREFTMIENSFTKTSGAASRPRRITRLKSKILAITPEFSVKLEDIASVQKGAYVYRKVGQHEIGFSIGIDKGSDEMIWVKLIQDNIETAYPLSRFIEGFEEDMPLGRYSFLYKDKNISAWPASRKPDAATKVSFFGLLDVLYARTIHVQFSLEEYALTYEDGKIGPISVSLLQKDREGRVWATRKHPKELSKIYWFLAVDETWYGMRIKGEELVFYSKPSPVKKLGILKMTNFITPTQPPPSRGRSEMGKK